MSLKLRFGLSLQFAVWVTLAMPSFAQQPAPPAQPGNLPAQQDQSTPPSASNVQPVQHPPAQEPYIIEDGGLSIEPIYWLNRAQPTLYGGAAAASFAGYSYSGNANASVGGELGIPAGRSNTLRISYFRAQGNANSTLTQASTIFSEAYNAGDYVTSNYTIQSAKISWDYLGYTWHTRTGKIRLKTLYEAQFVTVSGNFAAPFKAVTTDTSGNTDDNTAQGSKNLIYPTFGVEFEEALGRHVRWEVIGSGFGVPHHGDIWDAQADLAIHVKQVEILAGGKAFHFKTSTQADQYFTDTLSGAFVGLRYYWGHER